MTQSHPIICTFDKVAFAEHIKRYGVWLVAGVYCVVIIFCASVPVFWDMYGQVKTASFFLETGFRDLLPDGNSYSDNGHFPVYPIYLASLFKLFGFKLWVAHLSVLPFVLLLLLELKRFCRRFLSEERTLAVLLLTLAHPAVLTQCVHFSSEIAFVLVSLWLINALLYARSSHVAMASILLCLLNQRGIFLCGTLFLFFVFVRKQGHAWYLLCGLLAWASWLIVHYRLTGWYFAGDEIREFRTLADAPQMAKNTLLALWKLVDLGSVFAWVAVGGIALRTKTLAEPVKILLLVCAAVLVTCIPLTNPVSNRYFLLCYVLLLPAFIFSIGVLPRKAPWVIALVFAAVLFSNNWVMYDNRYGNAWDCSLKSLEYFGLRQKLDEHLGKQQIDPARVQAGFQVYFNDKYYLMNGMNREYALLPDHEMPEADYVVDSNIPNNFNEQREAYLRSNYTPEQSFESSHVYLRLYKKR